MADGFILSKALVDELRNLIAWRKAFRVTGDGVSMSNTPTSLSVTITSPTSFASKQNPLQRPCIVKVTGNASGGGKYNGRIVTTYPASDVSASGNLAASDVGTVGGSDDALVLNMQEMGLATHDLTSGTPVVTYFVGFVVRTNSDGKKVVAINGLDTAACT